ncbi:hypothetical protein [Staphylococcus simulans]|uniref:hypothetical protein n=1 Tax=Staphylococcus simulans TaxID=1286 RepID=UPI00131A1517|nr:hypothetical protein [Staphylococcus simulans]
MIDVPSENVTFELPSGVVSVAVIVIALPSLPSTPSLAFGMTTLDPSENVTSVLPSLSGATF